MIIYVQDLFNSRSSPLDPPKRWSPGGNRTSEPLIQGAGKKAEAAETTPFPRSSSFSPPAAGSSPPPRPRSPPPRVRPGSGAKLPAPPRSLEAPGRRPAVEGGGAGLPPSTFPAGGAAGRGAVPPARGSAGWGRETKAEAMKVWLCRLAEASGGLFSEGTGWRRSGLLGEARRWKGRPGLPLGSFSLVLFSPFFSRSHISALNQKFNHTQALLFSSRELCQGPETLSDLL